MNKHHIFVIVNLIGFLPLMWLTVTFSLLPIWIIFSGFGLFYAIATRDKSIDFNLMEASGDSEEGQSMLASILCLVSGIHKFNNDSCCIDVTKKWMMIYVSK